MCVHAARSTAMYVKHYNLKVKHFEITTDPEFLWLGAKHGEAYAMLRYGVLENKGILLLTGDVGVGKTTQIRALVRDLSDDIIYTTISDPGVTVMDFYRYLAHGFKLASSLSSKAEFLTSFRSFLERNHYKGKGVVLIIDEAQRMSGKLLEEVRLLSNMEENSTKLLNIFFVGQNEFLETLNDPRFRALRQRITLSYTIDLLDLRETYRYIAARLKKAGAPYNCFTQAAIEEIHMYSGGAPRVINLLCDMAMVVGYSKGVTRIEKQTVRDAGKKLPGVTIPQKKSSEKPMKVSWDSIKATRVAPIDVNRAPSSLVELKGPQKKGPAAPVFLLACLVLTLLFAIAMDSI
jgi:general secretion pathway protein A